MRVVPLTEDTCPADHFPYSFGDWRILVWKNPSEGTWRSEATYIVPRLPADRVGIERKGWASQDEAVNGTVELVLEREKASPTSEQAEIFLRNWARQMPKWSSQ